jgi:hypothetical protein
MMHSHKLILGPDDAIGHILRLHVNGKNLSRASILGHINHVTRLSERENSDQKTAQLKTHPPPELRRFTGQDGKFSPGAVSGYLTQNALLDKMHTKGRGDRELWYHEYPSFGDPSSGHGLRGL